MEKHLVGVDLGTSATKAALYTAAGELVAEAGMEVPLNHPEPGAVEQDHDDFYRTAAGCVRKCITGSGVDPKSIAAIAFDSQMAGVGFVDGDFRPVLFDSWLDMRCRPYIERIEKQCGGLVTRLTGCPPTCGHGPKIMRLKQERPADYARAAKFVMPACYVAGRLAGLEADGAYIDRTFLHFTALCDARRGEWSQELCGLLGVDPDMLPRIVEPWEVIGEAEPAAAADFGLAPGTPVAAGAGDTAAGALGAGIVRPGMLLDTAGTASALAACTGRFVADEEHRTLLTMRSVVPGLWHPLGYVGGGGLALRWFRDRFGPALGIGAECDPDGMYYAMTAAAASVPAGSEGLVFSPHLGGRVCPSDSRARGVWAGFSWSHTPAHFFRAVLESIAFEYAGYLSILGELDPGLDLLEARVIGGGAKSPVWNRIKADVLGVPYRTIERSEFATWGSAMIAGRAAGVFEDLAETARRAAEPKGEPVRPRPEQAEIYESLKKRYAGWQKGLDEAFGLLAETHLA